MRSKTEILENFRSNSGSEYSFESLLLEVLCDIRDKLAREVET